MNRWRVIAGGLLLALVLLGPPLAVRIAVPIFNPVLDQPGSPPSDEAIDLHATLAVADLHGDALLWDRGLVRRQSIGHIDVPRMIEGRVALQMFTAVTKTPASMNIEANTGGSDQITLLAVVQGWPPRTWTSLTQRALHQARKLRDSVSASKGRLVVVTSKAELDDFLRLRDADPEMVAGVLGIEGAHALEGEIGNVDRLFDAGYRMIGLTHFFDNEVGGSAHGVDKGGLTPFGREVLARMEELGIAIDLAHAAPALIDDVLGIVRTPVIVSHTGVKGTCDNQRNLDDDRLRAIGETGGVIGIGLWPTAVCGEDPAAWARAVRHAVEVAGVDHVGLGSDWDGAVAAIVDASGTVHLVDALLGAGFEQDEIRKVMGGNVIRVLRETLPDGLVGPG